MEALHSTDVMAELAKATGVPEVNVRAAHWPKCQLLSCWAYVQENTRHKSAPPKNL